MSTFIWFIIGTIMFLVTHIVALIIDFVQSCKKDSTDCTAEEFFKKKEWK